MSERGKEIAGEKAMKAYLEKSGLRIITLQAENIKKITAIEIHPSGEVVQITGKNGSGKSSVLDCIWWALAGTSNIQPQPIRKGEESAKITLDMGELTVTRTFSESGSQLSVKAPGVRYSSPQKVLDAMLGSLSFDPLAFSHMEPLEQLKVLRKLVKLEVDIDALDAANKIDYNERQNTNRQLKSVNAQIQAFGEFPAELPQEPIEVSVAAQEMAAISERNAQIDLAAHIRRQAIERVEKNISIATRKQAELKALLAQAEKDGARFIAELAALQEQTDEQKVDISELATRLKNSEAINAAIAKRKERDALFVKAKQLDKESDALTDAMDKRAREKEKAIEAAKMPVKGLKFGENGVLYNGIPIEQASTAEQLRVSCAIGMAGNPQLKVMLIKDGSLLDSDSMKIIAGMAKDNDWQIWIERVDTSGKVGIVMEDGHVKEVSA